MTFEYKGKEYTTPKRLADIKLGTYIDWMQHQEKKLICNFLNKDAADDTEALIEYYSKKFAHFTGFPVDELMNIDQKQLMNLQLISDSILAQEESEMSIFRFHTWKDEEWVIEGLFAGVTSIHTYEQMKRFKEMVSSYFEFSNGDWYALKNICASHLFKLDNETGPYTERLAMINELPLNIAFTIVKMIKKVIDQYNLTANAK